MKQLKPDLEAAPGSLDRRTLLKLLTAAAGGLLESPAIGNTSPRVVVAGAGIVGASIAWHLARAGAAVTVIDQVGPAMQASRGSFAWINATWAKQPRHYHSLNQSGVSSWHAMAQALDIPVRWGGSLEWFTDAQRQRQLEQQIAEQHAWGEPARMLRPEEALALEPGISFGDTEAVALSGNDGAVDPVLATRAMLRGARSMGALLRYPCRLEGTRRKDGRLIAVDTNVGLIEADQLVLATGAAPDAALRFAGIEIPQRTTPGVIATSSPLPPLLKHVVSAPGIHLHQRLDGRIVLGEQSGPPRNEAHALRLRGRPGVFPDPTLAAQHAARMLEVARTYLPAMGAATFDEVVIGWRPLPLDGHPVLGVSPAVSDVYLAIMHSGVSLAPIVGQLASQEVLLGQDIAALAPYRPDRSFEHIKRY